MKTRAELDEIYKRLMRRQRIGRMCKYLKNLDPHPLNQSLLLAVAFTALILMAVLGDYVQ